MLAVESIDLFYGAAQALRSVSFEAKPGRVTCVLGRNGVGKTSLMRAIIETERYENDDDYGGSGGLVAVTSQPFHKQPNRQFQMPRSMDSLR
jgi:ABC-type branched-subunit amino acid transport system ATPase component